MLSIIVAIANDNVIGKDNKLIWHIPEDLKRFKRITDGKIMIMGSKTFESLGRVLPNRKHLVLCNDGSVTSDNENVTILTELSQIDEYAKADEEVFVIGGATIYKLLMPMANKLYITKIEQDFEGDTYFPEIKGEEWEVVDSEKGPKNDENPFEYTYITYRRKN